MKYYKSFLNVLEKAENLKSKKLINLKNPSQLKDSFDFELKENPSDSSLETIINGIFDNSVNTQNPHFLNQLYGGSTQEAWLGELITSILNTSMATYEIAPLATLMEKELLASMNKEIGFDTFEGLIVPGGSYANMLGINCARFNHSKETKTKGMYGKKRQIVFVSQDAHYSSLKSLALMGLGTESLRKIKTDANKRMCPKDFEFQIQAVKDNNEDPICVVTTSGTTVWGAFDSIEEINVICKRENIWHHIDAAWGGLALWSENKDQLFKAVERVDSITLDFHKLMASTLTKGIFITSRPEVLIGANSGGGSEYIFHGEAQYDIGTYSIQCGRKVDAIALWLQWKLNGTKGYRDKASELYELQNWMQKQLQAKEDYELLIIPEYMNICFQIQPTKQQLDKGFTVSSFNKLARETLMERGNFMVNFANNKIDGYFFRLVLNHWEVNVDILKELIVELDTIKELL
jgi:glutamate/tyrosine decarboxylase-like PLP-dependent enzyme